MIVAIKNTVAGCNQLLILGVEALKWALVCVCVFFLIPFLDILERGIGFFMVSWQALCTDHKYAIIIHWPIIS